MLLALRAAASDQQGHFLRARKQTVLALIARGYAEPPANGPKIPGGRSLWRSTITEAGRRASGLKREAS